MTLNGEVSLISRYFTEFGSFPGELRKVVDKTITMHGQFTNTMSSSKRLQRAPTA